MLVGVQVSDIARMKPSVAKCGPREFFVAEVSFHYRGSTHHHLSRLTGGHATAVAIHNGHFVTGRATARTIPSLFDVSFRRLGINTTFVDPDDPDNGSNSRQEIQRAVDA